MSPGRAGRAALAAVVAALAAFAAAPCGAAPAAAEGAALPVYRANPARTGWVAEGPEPPLELRWKFKTRRGVMEIESFPAVDDGLSSATAADGTVYVGGHDGWVYALDAKTGRKRWESRTGGHVNSAPTPADGLLFVGSMDRNLYALRLTDGSPAWKFQYGVKTFKQLSYGGVRASPLVREGRVYVGG